MEFAAALSFLFSITLMKQSQSKRPCEWAYWQADFPPLAWGCFLHLMFPDKVLHRSKLKEPPLLTHVTVFASIMQSTVCGRRGRGGRKWERKGFVTRLRCRNESFFKKHSLENNIQAHLHESSCLGELCKAANIMESSLPPLPSLYTEYIAWRVQEETVK